MDDSIDSRQLRAFAALAHGGGLKAAAAALSITESAISHTIRNLEANLGVKLFLRTGKGLVLTPTGSLLLRDSVDILSRMRDIRQRLSHEEQQGARRIRIVAGTSFLSNLFPDIYLEFQECFPDTVLSVVAADRDTCLQQMERDEADVAVLVNIDEGNPALTSARLFTDNLHAVVSAGHPLANLDPIPVHALCRETLFVIRQNNYTTRLIAAEIARRAFQLNNVVEVSSQEGLREIIRLGLGFSFQTPWAFPGGWDDPALRWKTIPNLDLRRDWVFAWPRHREPDLRIKTLLRICKRAAGRLSSYGFLGVEAVLLASPGTPHFEEPPQRLTTTNGASSITDPRPAQTTATD